MTFGLIMTPSQATALGKEINLSELAKRTYTRTSSRYGGDTSARFQFSFEGDSWLENLAKTIFYDGLGQEIVESWGGVRSFRGIVSSVSIKSGGDVFSRTLRGMYNSVAVSHRTIYGNQFQTEFKENAPSIALYGRKQLIIPAKELMSEESADSYAEEELLYRCIPRTRIESVSAGSGVVTSNRGLLEVEVIGMSQTLDWLLYDNNIDTIAEEYIHTLIADMLTSVTPTYVTQSRLEATTKQASVVASFRPVLSRAIELAKIEGFSIGCYASAKLEMTDASTNLYSRGEFGYMKNFINGENIPVALFKPLGNISVQFDPMPDKMLISGSNSLSSLTNAIEGIEYTANDNRLMIRTSDSEQEGVNVGARAVRMALLQGILNV